MSHIVYSNTGVTSASGAISIGQHTDAIYFMNKDYNHFVEVRLNGGPHVIVLPEANKTENYIKVPGDYTSFQILTESATVAVYAVG